MVEIEELSKEKAEKEELISKENIEKEKLAKQKQQINGVVADLRKTEKALKREIEKRKREAEQIKKAISKILAE